MSILTALLLAGAPGFAPPGSLLPQDPPPAPEPEQEEVVQEKPPKEAFEKLSGSKRKKAQKAISALRGGKTEKAREEAVATLAELGEGVVPQLLEAWQSLQDAERGAELLGLLEELLDDDALHLAWPEAEADAPAALRAYLLSRWAASEREDAATFLRAHVQDEDPALAYQAGRGLALRGDASGFDAIAAWVQAAWAEQADAIRADFAAVERGPMSSKAAQLANSGRRKEQLAGLHLFELLGVKEHAALLLPALGESDTSLRLAAIDACRAAIDGDPPLERPSMTEIIERAEKWKKRIDQLQRERKQEGGR